MANKQTFTAYTEVDTATRMAIAAGKITVLALDNDEDSRLYKDFTAGYFSADFEHQLTFTCSSATDSAVTYLWGLSNTTTSLGTQQAANTTPMLAVRYSNGTIAVVEGNGSYVTTQDSTATVSEDHDYYLRICRNESVGTHGTLYCYIYGNSSCTELIETVSLALTVKTDFRYLFAFSGQGSGTGGNAWNGSVETLVLENHPFRLDSLIATVRYYLREATARFWSDAELTDYINMTVREIAANTGCIQRSLLRTTADGERAVAEADSKVIAVEYIPASGSGKYLRNITGMMLGHIKLTYDDGSPQYWFEEENAIGIEPIPNDTYSLRLYYSAPPDWEVSLDTDVPCLPPAYYMALIYNVVYLAMVKDNKLAPAVLINSFYNNEIAFHTADKMLPMPVGWRNLRAD